MDKSCVKTVYESKFLRVFDLQYREGKHYYDATRRTKDNIAAVKSDEEFRKMIPDAVSCFVILTADDHEPVILLSREFRYPAGHFLLSVPAGLIDPDDCPGGTPAITAAAREIHEETGLEIGEEDSISLVNPLVFSTPGMTDESNALVCAVIHSGTMEELKKHLTQDGATGSEKFDGFVLMTADQARKVLKDGKDDRGFFYPVYTWMALMYFISGMWKN